jgi:MFS family permease
MDRWGPRAVVPMGAILVIVGLYGATGVTTPLGFYLTLEVIVISGTMAMSHTSHSMFLPNWFIRRRGLAIGSAFSGVGIGSITLLPWFQKIIESSWWREACIIILDAVVAVIIPLAAYFQHSRPEEFGLEPDGDTTGNHSKTSAPIDLVVDKQWAATKWTVTKAVKTGNFWWIVPSYFTALFVW